MLFLMIFDTCIYGFFFYLKELKLFFVAFLELGIPKMWTHFSVKSAYHNGVVRESPHCLSTTQFQRFLFSYTHTHTHTHT